MKKKIIVIILLLAISVCQMSVNKAYALESSGNGYTYDSGTATVTILSDIEAWYFAGNEEIQQAIVREGVTQINNGCFDGCTLLKAITLPSTINYISYYAFDGCASLKEINYNGTIEEWSQIEICDNNESLGNAVIHCTDGDTTYTPPERKYDYKVSDIVKAEFFNVRDVYVGIDSYKIGIGANLTMKNGDVVYIDFGYEYEYDYSEAYGGLYELNRLCGSLEGEGGGGYIQFRTNSSNVDQNGNVVGTGTIPVSISISGLNIEYNNMVEINAMENQVKSIDVINPVTRKISYTKLKETDMFITKRTDILVNYSDSTQAALWEGVGEYPGWGYVKGSSSSFVLDRKLWNEQSVPSVLEIYGVERHRVEYVLGKKLEDLKVGETYPLIIKYMGREVTTYITVSENETENFNYGVFKDNDSLGTETDSIEEPAKPQTPQGGGTSTAPGTGTATSPASSGSSVTDQPSGTSAGTTKLTVPKTTLKKVKAAGKGKMKITWKRSSDAGGYQIQYAMNKKFTKKKKAVTAAAKSSSKVIKGLKAKKTYYVRIRAFKKQNGKKIYGKWSSVKKVKMKK